MKNTGRRFLTFWLLLITFCISGCCGCGNCCSSNTTNVDNSGCNSSDSCNVSVTPDQCDENNCSRLSVANGRPACLASGDFGGGETCQAVCDPGFAHCGSYGLDCETTTSTDPNNCGKCGNSCNGGICNGGVCSGDGGVNGLIYPGLERPSAIAIDTTWVYVVDGTTLLQIPKSGGSAIVLAQGVIPNGAITTDGVNVYWAGAYAQVVDGGALDDDAGDASSDDDGGDAGNDGGVIASIPGIFSVSVNGGAVVSIASIPALPGIAIDFANVYARASIGADSGASTLGFAPLDGGSFNALAGLTGNAEKLHAFALRTNDLVALDDQNLVVVPLDGGAKSVLIPNLGAIAVLSTDEGTVDVTTADASFTLKNIAGGASAIGDGVLGGITAHNEYIYVGVPSSGQIWQFFAPELDLAATPVASGITGPIDLLAADDAYVYWIVAGTGLFAVPAP